MSHPQNDKKSKLVPDTEVVPKAKRRQYSAEYMRRVLQEYEGCTELGEKGALLRREGLYSSHINTWSRQRENGELKGLAPQKRGAKTNPLACENARLIRENVSLRKRLEQAELIIEVQKKVSQILGVSAEENGTDETS